MTTAERNFPLRRLIQQCHRSVQDPGKGSYCFRENPPPASGETVARVTEKTGLCDVNVIRSDNSLQAVESKNHSSQQKAANETVRLKATRKADLEIDKREKKKEEVINSFHYL